MAGISETRVFWTRGSVEIRQVKINIDLAPQLLAPDKNRMSVQGRS
jgi:hypothetical protein